MTVTTCIWTDTYSCPGQEHSSDYRGPAQDDDSLGYYCCCELQLYKVSNAMHENYDPKKPPAGRLLRREAARFQGPEQPLATQGS